MDFFIKRKERIILTVIEIINELGFQGLSTKEITKRQDISDGTLYKHFKSKNEIIIATLEYYSKFDDCIKETIEINKFSPKESITFFFKMLAEYYENYPAITALTTLRESLQHEIDIAKINKQIFENRSKFMIHYLEKGKESREFKSDIDSELLTEILLGSFREIILKWRINNFNFPLKERIMLSVETILKLC